MDSFEKWLFPGTPIATVLRFRPMALSLLERHGMDPWNPNHLTIGELCDAKGIAMDELHAEMKCLPAPDADTDWRSRPIYHLLDYLTREHWKYINRMLPAIKHTLAHEYKANGDSLRRLRYLVEEWPAFSSVLEGHIHEEETFLFPKILHYEYSLRHRGHHPDFSGGSVDVFVALRLLDHEKEQMAVVRRFLNEVRFSKASEKRLDSLESRLAPLLSDLQVRLANHSALETTVLFPMAKAVEKALFDARISGQASMKDPSRFLMPT